MPTGTRMKLDRSRGGRLQRLVGRQAADARADLRRFEAWVYMELRQIVGDFEPSGPRIYEYVPVRLDARVGVNCAERDNDSSEVIETSDDKVGATRAAETFSALC